MAKPERITILLDPKTKQDYWHWCVDQRLPLGEPLREVVEWIVRTELDIESIRLLLANAEADNG